MITEVIPPPPLRSGSRSRSALPRPLLVEYDRVGENWIAHLVDSRFFAAGPTREVALSKLREALSKCGDWFSIAAPFDS